MIRWLDESAQATEHGTLEYELPLILIYTSGQILIDDIEYPQSNITCCASASRCRTRNIVVDGNTTSS